METPLSWISWKFQTFQVSNPLYINEALDEIPWFSICGTGTIKLRDFKLFCWNVKIIEISPFQTQIQIKRKLTAVLGNFQDSGW